MYSCTCNYGCIRIFAVYYSNTICTRSGIRILDLVHVGTGNIRILQYRYLDMVPTAVPTAVLNYSVLRDILGYYNKREVGRYTQSSARSDSVMASAPTSQRYMYLRMY